MIIFSLEGELLFSLGYESQDIQKILERWKEDTISDAVWEIDKDWEEEYYSVQHLLEWYHEPHCPFTGHLDRFGTYDFQFVKIDPSEYMEEEDPKLKRIFDLKYPEDQSSGVTQT